MGDIEELILLVDQQIIDGVTGRNEAKLRSDEANRRHEESQQKVEDLLEEIGRLRAAAAAAAPADGGAPAYRPALEDAA